MLLIKVFLFVCYCVSGQSVLLSLAPLSLGEYIKTDPIKKNKRRRGSDFEEARMGSGEEHYSKRRKKTTDSGEDPYKCDVCGKVCIRHGDLIKHKRTHTGDKPFQCPFCEKAFADSSNLIKHKRTHTGEKPYKCDACGKGFIRSAALRDHKRTHTGEDPYACDECGKGFIRSAALRDHKRTHTGEKPYKCDACGKGFIRNGDCKRHERTHTGEKPYACDECGHLFAQRGGLVIHKRSHTGEKPYKCDACELCFSQSGDCKRHKRTHTGEKPYACDLCDNRFSRSEALRDHKRTHSGEKPFSCNECGKEFTNHRDCKKHETGHFRKKSYECDQCLQRFAKDQDLTTHKKTHNKCTKCDQRVENLLSWDWHEKKHFENTSFGCPLCIKSFVRGGMLYVHLLTHFENRPLSVSCMSRGCKKQFYDIGELCFHCFTEHVKNPKLIEDLKIEFILFLKKLLKDKKVSYDEKSVRIFFKNNDKELIKWVKSEIENEKKKESPSLKFVEAIKSLLLEDLLTLLLEVRWSIREDIENQNRGLANNIPEKYYLLDYDPLLPGKLKEGELSHQEFALFLKIFLDVFSEKTVPEEIMSLLNKHVTDRSA